MEEFYSTRCTLPIGTILYFRIANEKQVDPSINFLHGSTLSYKTRVAGNCEHLNTAPNYYSKGASGGALPGITVQAGHHTINFAWFCMAFQGLSRQGVSQSPKNYPKSSGATDEPVQGVNGCESLLDLCSLSGRDDMRGRDTSQMQTENTTNLLHSPAQDNDHLLCVNTLLQRSCSTL